MRLHFSPHSANVPQLMMIYDEAIGLENFIKKTIRIPQRLTACSLPKPAQHPPPSVPLVALPAPEPKQVDSYHLTHVERQRRILNQLCLYCGGEGHIITVCPVQPPRPVVSTIQLPPKIAPLKRTTVHVLTPRICVSAQGTSSQTNFSRNSMLRGKAAPRI